MAALIVIEGLDGAGKSTQFDLLTGYLRDQRVAFEFLHFPRMETPPYGPLIARFLRGEFGALEQVNPYLVSLMYAGDRVEAAPMIRDWLAQGNLVLLDRYYHSNIAFQSAKIADPSEKDAFREWIIELECGHNRLPRPDLTVYLDVPIACVRDRLGSDRSGGDRDYLSGRRDIHEESMSLQERVAEEYLRLVETDPAFARVPCARADGAMATPDVIHQNVVKVLRERGVLR